MRVSDAAGRYARRFRPQLNAQRRRLSITTADYTAGGYAYRPGPSSTVNRIPSTVTLPSAGPFRSLITAHTDLRLSAELTPWARTHPDKTDIAFYLLICVSGRHPVSKTPHTPDPGDAAALTLALIGRTWGAHLYDVGHLTGHHPGTPHYFQLFLDRYGDAVDVPAYDTLIPRTKITPTHLKTEISIPVEERASVHPG